MNSEIKLQRMKREDINEVVKLTSRALNKKEGKAFKQVIDFHYFCKDNNQDDCKSYWVAKKDGKIIGMCELKRYIGEPKQIAWLGWLAVDPEFQRHGIGSTMMEKLYRIALRIGHRNIFIETYSDDVFIKARNFYKKLGFRKVGEIKLYLGKDIDMVVYGIDLKKRVKKVKK